MLLFFSIIAAALAGCLLYVGLLAGTSAGHGSDKAAMAFWKPALAAGFVSAICAPVSAAFAIRAAKAQKRYYLIATGGVIITVTYLAVIYMVFAAKALL